MKNMNQNILNSHPWVKEINFNKIIQDQNLLKREKAVFAVLIITKILQQKIILSNLRKFNLSNLMIETL